MFDFNIRSQNEVTEVSTEIPCVHCGKPDWCYRVGELTACKRGADPASGWEITSKTDKEGTPYYAPAAAKKNIRAKSRKEYFYPSRNGEPLIKVVRIDDGNGKKSFPQYHWNGQRWIKGVPAEVHKQVPIYRYQQVRKAIASGKTVFMVEGEGCADALALIGICATTTLGGSGKYKSYGSYQEDLAGADLVLCPDRDEPGVKHMEAIASDFPDAQWLYAPPSDFYWQRLPKSQGLDVSDWLNNGATAEDIRAVVTKKKFGLPSKPYVEAVYEDDEEDEEPLTAPKADQTFNQKAVDALYGGDRWISINNRLYRWVGTHYEKVSTTSEKLRIATYCNATPTQTKSGDWRYSYAKSASVEEVWNWVLLLFGVDPGEVNPPGLNCLNGVIKLSWKEYFTPVWELVPHDPAIIYDYVGQFEFDPNADPEACDRLLSCLEPEQRRIFIQTLAASLDLNMIRKFRGRGIRALLCKGEGNNGKDSLREAVQTLYGVGVVNCTVSDFFSYDQGRKFTLAKLENARISWSSENSSFSQLDNVQSLKAAITGDPIDLERKNQDERMMQPCTVFFFNINSVPNMQASLEAIKSRWAVLSFDKVFKEDADASRGEIEADSRFRYDPTFLQREVVPALLNKMLAALPEVATKTIDYRCTEEALDEIQRDTNHLRAFCQDVGLREQTGGRIFIGELWEILFQWYLDNGYVEITTDAKGKEKSIWGEPPRRGDTLVKASHQVTRRFLELFPKLKREEDTSTPDKKGYWYLEGIALVELGGAKSGADGGAETLSQSGGGAGGATLSTLRLLFNQLQDLDHQQVQSLVEQLKREDSFIAPPAPLVELVRLLAPPSAPLLAPPSSTDDVSKTIIVKDSKVYGESDPAVIVSNAVGKVGNITQDNSTKNFPPASVPGFKEGDRVAHSNPGQTSYNWHGRIVKFHLIGESQTLFAEVKWKESRRKEPFMYQLSDLRLI